jgi:enoyl-CoA hydratase
MDPFFTAATTPYASGKMLAGKHQGVGILVFNQPEKRNAMSVEMWDGMSAILDDFAADKTIRVVVLTGAGDKAFVSGADISQFEKQRSNADAQKEYEKLTSSGRAKLAAFAKPVIARIQGFCMGGGLGIAMQADIRIASADSQFAIPAARLSIAYGFDMVRKLTDLVGPAQARLILYTGARLDAAEAARIGLVNRTTPAETLSADVLKIARAVAENAPLSIHASKLSVAAAMQDPADRDMAAVHAASVACFDSADYKEGRMAFMEKRSPVFTGR